MLAYIAAAPVNHVLRGESWALRRLQPHAGKTARFDVFPFSLAFTVRDDGEVTPAMPQTAPDASFVLTPPVAIRILAGDADAYALAAVSGDPEFAQAIEFVVRNARWDLEEDLARIFGDTAAHRMAQGGRSLLAFPAQIAGRFARNLSDYWVEEQPLVARRSDVESFVSEVDTLRDDVERLAQRIARIPPP